MRIRDWSSDVCSSDLQLRRLARHALGALAHRRDLAVEHAKGVAPFRLDLAHRVLIFLQPLVDRVQQRLQILHGALFALLEARVGAFEKRLLRPVEHRLSDLTKLRGERRLRILERSEEPTSELQSLMRIENAVFCVKTKQ